LSTLIIFFRGKIENVFADVASFQQDVYYKGLRIKFITNFII